MVVNGYVGQVGHQHLVAVGERGGRLPGFGMHLLGQHNGCVHRGIERVGMYPDHLVQPVIEQLLPQRQVALDGHKRIGHDEGQHPALAQGRCPLPVAQKPGHKRPIRVFRPQHERGLHAIAHRITSVGWVSDDQIETAPAQFGKERRHVEERGRQVSVLKPFAQQFAVGLAFGHWVGVVGFADFLAKLLIVIERVQVFG